MRHRITLLLLATLLGLDNNHAAAGPILTNVKSPTQNALNDVYFPSRLHGFAAGDDGTILATSDGGKSWRRQDSGVRQRLNGIFFLDRKLGFATGDNGTLLVTASGGSSWRRRRIQTQARLNAIHFADRSHGVTVGRGGKIFATSDQGGTWTQQAAEQDPFRAQDLDFTETFMTGPQSGFALDADGSLIYATTDGSSWSPLRARFSFPVLGMSFFDARQGYLVGTEGNIIATQDAAETWIPLRCCQADTLSDAAFVSYREGVAVGTVLAESAGSESQKGIVLWAKGGKSWTSATSSSAATLNAVHVSGRDTAYAVGGQGKIIKISLSPIEADRPSQPSPLRPAIWAGAIVAIFLLVYYLTRLT